MKKRIIFGNGKSRVMEFDEEFLNTFRTLAKKTLGISYAEAEEFALSVYRQYILSLPNENSKIITEKVIRDWQSQVIVPHDMEKGVADKCRTDL